MLNRGGELDYVGGSREDKDGTVGLVLDEPLAGWSLDCGVQKLSADEYVRPGACLGGRHSG
ncbi:hypothetical protein ACK389_10700 [Streptomyces antibioticus]|uniref:hypothetical protein n=1 Tax=Streptomyces TaxID=1883 RepID=UPI0016796940|nr:hypothetical protein [Streptomyces tanashiensis]GGT22082.1 hypothetical protein GCM10010222_74970 [Streptomyces tanashiensis]